MTTKQIIVPKLEEIQLIRDSFPLPSRVSEMYDPETERLRNEYLQHRPAERALQRYHKRTGEAVRNRADLPIGLRQALHLPLVWNQIVHQYPWAVMWVRTVNGKRARGKKLCTSLGHAIAVQKKVSKVAPNATVVSRSRGYDIPSELRGKLPPRWYWCPRCMKPRRYVRDEKNETTTVNKKVWSKAKGRYVWVERKVYILWCPMCGCSNRDPIFRRSNQPWEVRKFKRGVTRARRRKKRT